MKKDIKNEEKEIEEYKGIKTERKTLDELLEKVTPENRHPVTDWGPPVGNEIW